MIVTNILHFTTITSIRFIELSRRYNSIHTRSAMNHVDGIHYLLNTKFSFTYNYISPYYSKNLSPFYKQYMQKNAIKRLLHKVIIGQVHFWKLQCIVNNLKQLWRLRDPSCLQLRPQWNIVERYFKCTRRY